jgi:hypothetical protein
MGRAPSKKSGSDAEQELAVARASMTCAIG